MAHIGFDALSKQLAAKGAKEPDALAAWIGRKKYGRKQFAALANSARSDAVHAPELRLALRPATAERSATFALVDANSDSRTLTGYAAIFDHPTMIRDEWGEFEEVISRGAFRRSLEERTPVLMFEHGRHPLIGGMPLGRIVTLREDAKGLYVEARLSDNWLIQPVRDAIRDGAVGGMSFRFTVPQGGDVWQDRDGRPQLRTVRDATVIELGPVVFPAYKPTTASIRSLVEQLPGNSGRTANAPAASVEPDVTDPHDTSGHPHDRTAEPVHVHVHLDSDVIRSAVRAELDAAGITARTERPKPEPPAALDPAPDAEPRATPTPGDSWTNAVAHLKTPADGWAAATAHLA